MIFCLFSEKKKGEELVLIYFVATVDENPVAEREKKLLLGRELERSHQPGEKFIIIRW